MPWQPRGMALDLNSTHSRCQGGAYTRVHACAHTRPGASMAGVGGGQAAPTAESPRAPTPALSQEIRGWEEMAGSRKSKEGCRRGGALHRDGGPGIPLNNDTGEKPAGMAAKLCLMGNTHPLRDPRSLHRT